MSAHCRIGSLLALWGVLLFMGPLGWLFVPVTIVRSAASFAQAFLNVRLGKKFPVEPQTRVDWVLVGAVIVGYLLFGDVPGANVWIGAAAIVGVQHLDALAADAAGAVARQYHTLVQMRQLLACRGQVTLARQQHGALGAQHLGAALGTRTAVAASHARTTPSRRY